MHVLIIPSWYSHLRSAGGGSFFRDQAQALAAAGHKVGLIYPRVWGLRDYRTKVMPTMDRITVEDDGPVRVYRINTLHYLPRLPYRDSHDFCAAGRKLFRAYLADEGPPDVIHAHGILNAGVLGTVLGRRHGLPCVITEHSAHFAQGRHRRWQNRLISRALVAAAARLAVSNQLADLMGAQFGPRALPITVVPNILPLAFEAELPAPTARPAGAPFRFLCVARISPEKNQDGLIRAFAKAFPGRVDTELHFIGPGDGAPLERLAADLGLGGRVRLWGLLPGEQVRVHMAAAGAVVLASFVETFGVVLIEAQAVGRPVIATACGGPGDIVTPANGILIPADDPAALVDALTDMARRAGDFDAARLRRDCMARYGAKAVVGQLESIYHRVLGARETERKGDGARP